MKKRGILKLFVILGLVSSLAPGLYSNGIFVNSIGAKAISMGGHLSGWQMITALSSGIHGADILTIAAAFTYKF